MDDYDPLARMMNYAYRGLYIGIAAGAAAGIFGAEQIADAYECSTLARRSLDVLFGIVGIVPGGLGGMAGGAVTGGLVSLIIRTIEDFCKKE
jgi:hypothetical protein